MAISFHAVTTLMYTSQLQKRVIDALYPPIQPNDILKNIHVINGTVLRYLDLQGAYLADAPLVLPSLLSLDQMVQLSTLKILQTVYLMVFRT